MILLTIIGTLIGSVYSSSDDLGIQSMLKKTLLFPPFIAVIIGFILLVLGFSAPVELDQFLFYNGTATTYLALFVVGLGLRTKIPSEKIKLTIESISVRQLFVPVIIGILLLIAGLSHITTQVLLLEAMMPAAVITAIFAGSFKLDAEISASIVTIGTLLLLPIVLFMPFLFS
jgi:predicted permease